MEGKNHPRLIRGYTEIRRKDWVVKVSQKVVMKTGHVERFNERHRRRHHYRWLYIAVCSVHLQRLLLSGSFESSFPNGLYLGLFCLIFSVALKWMLPELHLPTHEGQNPLLPNYSKSLIFDLSSSYRPLSTNTLWVPVSIPCVFLHIFQHSNLFLQIKEIKISLVLLS